MAPQPKPNASEVDGITALIKKFKKVKKTTSTKELLLLKVTEMVQRLGPSLTYHKEYSFQWANGRAKELLFETAIERGMVGALRGLFQIMSARAKGQALEAMFSYVTHPHPYPILDSQGVWTKMTLDLSQAFRSQDDKTISKNVTLFPETGSPPFELIMNTLFTLHGDNEVGKPDFAHLVRRFDPLSKQHKDFDLYVGDYPGGLNEEVRVLLLQITASLSHPYRPGRLYKMTNKFKRMLAKKLNLPLNRIVVMPVIVSTFDYVKVASHHETVAESTQAADDNDIDAVSQNDIDKGKKLPFFYINMNKTVETVESKNMSKTVKPV